ncbi:OsmC-like protein [Leptospira broomii serovar Hurstbridge str. 5399]|uniref:OsmC-like protein n=1 Tax=Leptospira broomii serovar Hurstbridge str. 5399 TaxID=1049789 RepID=T0F177_9LEPT|nr:OsmC family protein [Leptospira broomii]EQA44910.1 OsmC-like protein [Leptospira broomii serovar Hurstbridge str. 5399]
MSEHRIHLIWKKGQEEFKYEVYDRTHSILFDGGQEIQGSSTPSTYGKAEFANPEEMIAAALSSCHMLTFLAVAAKRKYVVLEYEDLAVSTLDKNPEGKQSVIKIDIHPKTKFSKENVPTEEELKLLHELSHKSCFIGNSIKSEVLIHPILLEN